MKKLSFNYRLHCLFNKLRITFTGLVTLVLFLCLCFIVPENDVALNIMFLMLIFACGLFLLVTDGKYTKDGVRIRRVK